MHLQNKAGENIWMNRFVHWEWMRSMYEQDKFCFSSVLPWVTSKCGPQIMILNKSRIDLTFAASHHEVLKPHEKSWDSTIYTQVKSSRWHSEILHYVFSIYVTMSPPLALTSSPHTLLYKNQQPLPHKFCCLSPHPHHHTLIWICWKIAAHRLVTINPWLVSVFSFMQHI